MTPLQKRLFETALSRYASPPKHEHMGVLGRPLLREPARHFDDQLVSLIEGVIKPLASRWTVPLSSVSEATDVSVGGTQRGSVQGPSFDLVRVDVQIPVN